MQRIVETVSNFFVSVLLFLLWTLTISIVVVVVKVVLQKYFFRKSLEKKLSKNELVYLFLKISPHNEQKEDAMVAFLQTVHRILPNNTAISLEMASSNQFLRFYLTIPKVHKNIFESQLYAQYPEAEIEEVEDFLPDLTNAAVAQINFKHSSMYPINSYHKLEEGMLKTLSAILSKTEPKEEVYFQIALKRIGSRPWHRGVRATHYLLVSKNSSYKETPVSSKLSQDLYRGKLRIAYIAADKLTAERKLKSLIGVFRVVKGDNELKSKKPFMIKTFLSAFKTRMFESGDLWTAAELATIYHFPYKGTVVSNVVHTNSKRAPAPDILPRVEQSKADTLSVIGETNYRNEGARFGMQRIDRRRHAYVVGKTGVGKSRLLELLMISDIKQGAGLCLLDPHGDLAEAVLLQIPKNRVQDVVYVNPADRDFPIAFNPLEYTNDHEKRQHIAYFFISIFKKIFASDWNERMEHILRYIILALLESPDSNVLGIPRILSDTKYRHRVINQLQDPVVKTFWANEFASWNEQYSSQAIVPILNKVGQFISNPIIRNMVGQQKNVLDFEQLMNKGKIVIINVSKGKLGEENAALLGSMFITKIQQAALSRANIPEEERKDFYFYIDEFQNFATEAFKSILSESRKYRLNLTIAHQYIDQLTDDMRSSVFGNVASVFVFSVGGADAAYLEKEFSPVFTADDMINLEAREMYIKMSINGRIAQPFSARTIDTPKPQFNYTPDIVSITQTKYTTNRIAVERSIEKWSKATEATVEATTSSDDYPEPIL